MTQRLWTPAGSHPIRRAELPSGDRTLPDGRRLLFQGRVPGQHLADLGAVWWRCRDGLQVVASLDPTPHGSLLHVSVAYQDRDPEWATIRSVRDALFPSDLDVMMVLPRETDYINEHSHCFHLWQTPRTWGIR